MMGADFIRGGKTFSEARPRGAKMNYAPALPVASLATFAGACTSATLELQESLGSSCLLGPHLSLPKTTFLSSALAEPSISSPSARRPGYTASAGWGDCGSDVLAG